MYLTATTGLGHLSGGPLLSDDQVAAMTQAINDAATAAANKLGRPLTTAEKLAITAGVQREWGLSPKFDQPVPGTLSAIYQGIISFFGTALYRSTVGLPAAGGDAGQFIGKTGGAAIGGFFNGVGRAFSDAEANAADGVSANLSTGRIIVIGAVLLGALWLIGRASK